MVTDRQVRKLMRLLNQEKRLSSAAELDELRRKMVTILNTIDKSRSQGQGFARRVSLLRENGTLPAHVA